MKQGIPDNEFSSDPMLQQSMDVMYFNYLLRYTEKTCVTCGFQWQQKNSEPILSDLCYKCRKEALIKMNGGKE